MHEMTTTPSKFADIQARRSATDASHAKSNREALLEHARMGRPVCFGDGQGGVRWVEPVEVFAMYGLDEFGREKPSE